jgi:hypothetical protein
MFLFLNLICSKPEILWIYACILLTGYRSSYFSVEINHSGYLAQVDSVT